MRVERVSGICGPRGVLTSIDFQPHSEPREIHRLATAGGSTIKIWSIEWLSTQGIVTKNGSNGVKCHCLYTNSSHSPYDVVLVRFSFDGRLLLSVSSKGSVIIFKMKANSNTNTSPTSVTPIKLSQSNKIYNTNPIIHNDEWYSMDELIWPNEIGQVSDACWAPDNRSVAAGGSTGVAVLDIYTRQVVAMFGVPGIDECVIESVKSLSWDPMTIFIAVTSTTSFSLWRRSKNESSKSYYKWNFTLEKLVPTQSLSQLISYRPSWCPRGRLISIPFKLDLPLKNDDKINISTMGCNIYLLDKPEYGSSVSNSPIQLLGHLNKITNVRFSSDIIKYDEYLGGARVALFAQTSDDGVLSVWTLAFDGSNSKCLLALSSILDEQVAVSDIAWGNRGSWLAIAQTCGGIILLDFKHSDINATFYTNWMKGRKVPDTLPPLISPNPNLSIDATTSSKKKSNQNIGYGVNSKEAMPNDSVGNQVSKGELKCIIPKKSNLDPNMLDVSHTLYYEVITCFMAFPNNSLGSDDEMTWLDMDSTQFTPSMMSSQVDSVDYTKKASIIITPKIIPPRITSTPIVQDKRSKRGRGSGKSHTAISPVLPVHTSISPTCIAVASYGVVTLMKADSNLWKPVFTINMGREVLSLSNDNGYIAIVAKANDVPSVTVLLESTGQVVMATNLLGELVTKDSIVRTRISATTLVIAIFNKGKSFTISNLTNGIFTRVMELGNQQSEFLHKVTGFAILDSSANVNYQMNTLQDKEASSEIDLLICIFKTSDGHVHLCPAVGKSIGKNLPLNVGKIEAPPPNGSDALKECFKICIDRSTRPSLMVVASCLIGNTSEFTYWYSSLLSQLIKEQNIDRLICVIEALFKSKIFPLESNEAVVIDDKIDNPLYRRFLKQLPLNLEKIAEGLIYPILRGEFKGLAKPIPEAGNLLANIPLWIREIQLMESNPEFKDE